MSGSDDFTMFLWSSPTQSKHPTQRMTGHKNLVNQVQFSPDGQWIASASFDKSVKLWNGHTGQFVTSFFGHVGHVYQVSWSADSRLICRYVYTLALASIHTDTYIHCLVGLFL